MTDYERALIVGQYLSFSKNNGIDPRLFKRGFTDDQIKQMRTHMGQETVMGLNLRFDIDLNEMKHPDFNFIYTVYDAWNSHHCLPFKGSYTEQPNRIIEHFQTLDELRHESEQKTRAKADREAKVSKGKR